MTKARTKQLSVAAMMEAYDKTESCDDLDKLTRRILKGMNWGKHRKCTYFNCAVSDVFSMILMSRSDLVPGTYKFLPKDENKAIKACEKLAVEILLTIEDRRRNESDKQASGRK